MQKSLSIVCILVSFSTLAQTEATLLKGKVLYQNTSVPNENVINITTERATVTNQEGEFEIMVKTGDKLAFTAMNYQLKTVEITDKIIANKRLVVVVEEKITALDEVIVTPENREAYIRLKNEEFKKHVYEKDAAAPITNYALPVNERGMVHGLDFINIFKALLKSNKEKKTEKILLPSQVLRQVYDDTFFVSDLKIPQDQINEFLYYVDDKLPSQTLLKKNNEFELIDFLVNQSKNFNALKASEN